MPEEPVVATPEPPVTTPVAPRRPPRRRPATVATNPPTPVPSQPQVAAIAPPAPPVELGELTTGDEASNANLRQQTDELLRTQGKRLIDLPSLVAAAHPQQVEQARLYLRQAADAWQKLDIEGARTLATKAKVLLDEILQ